MVEKDVIAVLTERKNWERYGKQFNPSFFQSEGCRSLFNLLDSYYFQLENEEVQRVEKETFLKLIDLKVSSEGEKAKLYSLVGKIFEIVPNQIEVVVKEALSRWRAGEILLSAERDLANDTFDPAIAAKQLSDLSKALEIEEIPEIFPNQEVLSLLESAKAQNVYPTGLAELDSELEGGAWEGHLNVVLAKLSGGKTLFLSHVAKTCLLQGIPVYGETCEESRQEWIIRVFQGLLQKSRPEILRKSAESASLIEAMDLPPWNIKDRRERGIYIPRLRRDLEKFISQCGGRKPVVLLDQMVYGGVFPTNRSIIEPRFQLATVAEELIGLAAEFGISIWAPTQSNRAGWGKEYITSVEVAECLDIPRKAHVVISLNQNAEEEEHGSMRIWLDKARERKPHKRLFTVRVLQEFQSLEEFV